MPKESRRMLPLLNKNLAFRGRDLDLGLASASRVISRLHNKYIPIIYLCQDKLSTGWIEKLDHQIDEEVYGLYGLTEEEIKIIENS